MPKPERLVIDTTILFSALLYDGPERQPLKRPVQWMATDYNKEELKRILQKKAAYSLNDAEHLLELLPVIFIPLAQYENRIDEASVLIGGKDRKDIPCVALALSIANDGIWTSDRHFQGISGIRVWTSREILEEFEKD